MRLDDLKKLVSEKKAIDMGPIYDVLKENALDGSESALFIFRPWRTDTESARDVITEEEIEQLKEDGYEVDWREEQVTVSGW